MRDHLDKNVQKHLDQACNKVREIGADLREKTFQLSHHSEKLALLAAEQVRVGFVYTAKNAQVDLVTDLINKPISGCVHMVCDSLLTTSLLQIVNRLVAS